MYVRHNLGVPPAADVPPPAERAQREEMARHCKGINVLQWLQRGPDSLREYIAYLEQRLAATPRLVEGHHNLRGLRDDLNRALRARGKPPVGFLKARFEEEKQKILAAYPEMTRFAFPPDYVVGNVDEEIAQVRCKLSRARLDFQMWNRTGRRPSHAAFLRLCSPRPGPRLTLWTIRGFALNDDKLNKGQLSEIELIAGGLARNPRTRTGMPVLTITGGFAPGETAGRGNGRAIAVKNALADALRRIDPSLLRFVGFNLASEGWCSEVWISVQDRIP